MAAEELCKPKTEEALHRTAMLLGTDGVTCLNNAHVAVFGIGGVGGYVVEALARSGVGTLTLVDHDKVSRSNLNRQIVATTDTVGRYKTEVMRERVHSIRPDTRVVEKRCFFLPENRTEFDFSEYDYIVDAVDTVTAKLALAEAAEETEVPIISSMGTGNKLDPTRFEVADIYQTSVCPLARVMRRELKARGIKALKVVYSKEEAMKPLEDGDTNVMNEEGCDFSEHTSRKKAVPGSVAFVPSVAGLIIAGEVIKDIVRNGAES